MGVMDAMAEAAKVFVETASEIVNPRGVVVVVSRKVPDIYATNESLATWKSVRAAIDQDCVPVVVFENANQRNQRNQGHVLSSIVKMSGTSDGKPRAVIAQPTESITDAVDRARDGLALPIVGAVVGYPPAHRRLSTPGSFPQQLREHFMRDNFMRDDSWTGSANIVAVYADAQIHREERVVVNNGFGGQSVRSQLELDSSDLGHYDAVVTPSRSLTEDLTNHISSRIDMAFAGAYELFGKDGKLRVLDQETPKARYVTHEMGPETRAAYATDLASVLGIESSVHVTERGIERSLERGFHPDYSTPNPAILPSDTQDSFTLGA